MLVYREGRLKPKIYGHTEMERKHKKLARAIYPYLLKFTELSLDDTPVITAMLLLLHIYLQYNLN